jgi:aminopeptidase N
MKYFFSILFIFISIIKSFSQETFTRKDSLQGGLRFERTCFDVLHYDLNVKIIPSERAIKGYNIITFKIVENTKKIQLDLFENMQIDSIVFENKNLLYKREYNAVFIEFDNFLQINSKHNIQFYYSGKPKIAKRPPWDGGFIWKKDSNGNDLINVAVQGTGASLWFPVKDSQTDEPDYGAKIKVAVPNGLMNVSNGRFIGKNDLQNGYTQWNWEVKNPINNYNITINIGDYVHFSENYKGLDLDYYVLRENESKAKKQFEQVKPMLDCFQLKFGTYPFKEDGYKLIETSYLGMEHQSAVSYGNKYKNGYLGTDLSGTGVGLLFDYIIIHESGHEWFGNSITSSDIADLWIHEAFTMYSESVYLECHYGYEKAQIYINGLSENIEKDKPIIGKYGVNNEGSVDMYYKGALMLNTIRHIINDDQKWWKIIYDFSTTYRHQIIDTPTVIEFFNTQSGMNLTPIFNQYLKYVSIPILEIKLENNYLKYRWETDESNFEMPLYFEYKNKKVKLEGANNWKTSTIKIKKLNDVKLLQNLLYYDVFYM